MNFKNLETENNVQILKGILEDSAIMYGRKVLFVGALPTSFGKSKIARNLIDSMNKKNLSEKLLMEIQEQEEKKYYFPEHVKKLLRKNFPVEYNEEKEVFTIEVNDTLYFEFKMVGTDEFRIYLHDKEYKDDIDDEEEQTRDEAINCTLGKEYRLESIKDYIDCDNFKDTYDCLFQDLKYEQLAYDINVVSINLEYIRKTLELLREQAD